MFLLWFVSLEGISGYYPENLVQDDIGLALSRQPVTLEAKRQAEIWYTL